MPFAVIQLVTAPGFVSWAIRRATFSEYSHVDYVIEAGTAYERLLGAHIRGGVRVRPADYERFTARRRLAADVSDQQRRLIETFLGEQVGKPYDLGAIANLLTQRKWRGDGNFLSRPKWFCSELVAAAFEVGGAPLLNPGAQVWRISPRDLILSPFLH